MLTICMKWPWKYRTLTSALQSGSIYQIWSLISLNLKGGKKRGFESSWKSGKSAGTLTGYVLRWCEQSLDGSNFWRWCEQSLAGLTSEDGVGSLTGLTSEDGGDSLAGLTSEDGVDSLVGSNLWRWWWRSLAALSSEDGVDSLAGLTFEEGGDSLAGSNLWRWWWQSSWV